MIDAGVDSDHRGLHCPVNTEKPSWSATAGRRQMRHADRRMRLFGWLRRKSDSVNAQTCTGESAELTERTRVPADVPGQQESDVDGVHERVTVVEDAAE
jgi:hypothetical protein